MIGVRSSAVAGSRVWWLGTDKKAIVVSIGSSPGQSEFFQFKLLGFLHSRPENKQRSLHTLPKPSFVTSGTAQTVESMIHIEHRQLPPMKFNKVEELFH
jgi:hypothetical protein